MSHEQIIFESLKLSAQFAGALLIAWLTVGWALARYKSEKTWERRLIAFTDTVTAVGDMQAVVGNWFDEAIEDREPSAAHQERQQQRFHAARRRLDEGIATALLLLPAETAERLSLLQKELDQARHADSLEEHLDQQYGVLKRALIDLVEQGRTTLKMT